MEVKYFFVLCVEALFIKYISSQCNNNAYDNIIWSNGGNNLAWETGGSPYSSYNGPYAPPSWPAATSYATAEWAPNYSSANLAASNGGGLPVTSSSQIPPSGIYMASENAYSGPLAVSGAMPFLGTVALEGALPTAGAGAVAYGCGNGNIAMMSENIPGYNAYSSYGYAPSNPDYGYSYASPASEYGYGYASTSGCSNLMSIDSGFGNPTYGYNYIY